MKHAIIVRRHKRRSFIMAMAGIPAMSAASPWPTVHFGGVSPGVSAEQMKLHKDTVRAKVLEHF